MKVKLHTLSKIKPQKWNVLLIYKDNIIGTKLSKDHQHQRARIYGNLESARHHLALPQIKQHHFKKLFPDLFYMHSKYPNMLPWISQTSFGISQIKHHFRITCFTPHFWISSLRLLREQIENQQYLNTFIYTPMVKPIA